MNDVNRYAELLRQKLDILENIYSNTFAQSAALDGRDDKKLEKLLLERQRYIDKFAELEKCISLKEDDNTEETLNLKLSVNSKLHEIIKQDTLNIENAKKRQAEIAQSIKHVKTGELALRRGYYRKIPQQYGYFFDKRIGK